MRIAHEVEARIIAALLATMMERELNAWLDDHEPIDMHTASRHRTSQVDRQPGRLIR